MCFSFDRQLCQRILLFFSLCSSYTWAKFYGFHVWVLKLLVHVVHHDSLGLTENWVFGFGYSHFWWSGWSTGNQTWPAEKIILHDVLFSSTKSLKLGVSVATFDDTLRVSNRPFCWCLRQGGQETRVCEPHQPYEQDEKAGQLAWVTCYRGTWQDGRADLDWWSFQSEVDLISRAVEWQEWLIWSQRCPFFWGGVLVRMAFFCLAQDFLYIGWPEIAAQGQLRH